MKAFRFVRPRDATEAAEALAENSAAQIHAGGADLLDRLKENVAAPEVLVSLVDAAGLQGIELEESGDVRIGARATLSEIAASDVIARFLPTLAEAAGDAASPQLRNRATLGGNLLQETRCGYYRHESFPCLRRGGDHCPVLVDGGVQEHAGIIHNKPCASAHPSSIAPVLGSLDAEVIVRRGGESRILTFDEFWAAPGDPWANPKRRGVGDSVLDANDLAEAILIPARDTKQFVGHSEVRQKAAFDWSLMTCSVRYELEGETIKDARVWYGSIAPSPWRATKAEQALRGTRPTDAAAEKAASAAMADATPLAGTTYKVQLAKVALKRALAAARGR